MSEVNAYTCTPRQATKFVGEILHAGLVPYLEGAPGIGKSAIGKLQAKENNLKLIDHRLSTSAPEDMSGLPHFVDGKAHFAPFAGLFPTADVELPNEKDGWLLFLDELPSAPKSVQAAAYKLILDKEVGQHKLHENVAIMAAGNRMSDKAIVHGLGTAMQSRLIHLKLAHNFTEWLEDVAIPEQYDPRIIAFLSQFPGKLMDFNPDHKGSTYCCPRTWEFMNRLIQGKKIKHASAPMYTGTITEGVAVEFITYTEIFDKLIPLREILADPENARLPQDVSEKWAAICMLMEDMTKDNFAKIATYADRFTSDFRVLFYRMAIQHNRDLRSHPSFTSAMVSLARYLKL